MTKTPVTSAKHLAPAPGWDNGPDMPATSRPPRGAGPRPGVTVTGPAREPGPGARPDRPAWRAKLMATGMSARWSGWQRWLWLPRACALGFVLADIWLGH